MVRDCIVVEPLPRAEMPVDSEADLMESDVVIEDSDDDDGLEERMEGLEVYE